MLPAQPPVDPKAPISLAVPLLRRFEADMPELYPLEADVSRIDQAVLARIKAKAMRPGAPHATRDGSSSAPGSVLSTRFARWRALDGMPIMLAGFAPPEGDAGHGTSSREWGRNVGLALGLTATFLSDLSDTIPDSNRAGIGASEQMTEGGVRLSIGLEFGRTADGTRTSGMSYELQITREGVSLSCRAAPRVEGNVCPDGEGRISLKYAIVVRCDGSAGGKRIGFQEELTGTATAHVDDAAFLTSIDFDSRSQNSEQQLGGHNAFVDFTFKGSLTGGSRDGFKIDIKESAIPRVGSATSSRDQELLTRGRDDSLDALAAYMSWLEYEWRNGYCVAIRAAVPDRVKPGSSTSIDVSVVQKPGGAVIRAPIETALKGQASLAPARIDPSPGSATYVAPSQSGGNATLTFKSTSRRGIGQLDATVNLGAAYTASGGKFSMSGSVCDLEKPFHLTGHGDLEYHFTFNPGSANAGSMNYSGSGGGCTESGRGTYTVRAGMDQKSLTVDFQVSGKVGCFGAGGSFTGGADFTLTEAPSASCR